MAQPIVIGHRGAPGYLPDHTVEGYTLAVEQGADYIEPDLVATRDGVLIARHENDLSETTNVAQLFPDRRRTQTIDSIEVDGFFSEDFTYAEIQTLRARQPLPFRSSDHNDSFKLVTFDTVLELAKALSQKHGRVIGVYPETKHPTHFRKLGIPMEQSLVASLQTAGMSGKSAPVFVQSFEVSNLRMLKTLTQVSLIQLIGPQTAHPADALDGPTYGEMMTPPGLAEIATYATGIGVHKSAILPVSDGVYGTATSLVQDAHQAGLKVHVYTFRAEDRYLPTADQGAPEAEIDRFLKLGIDGFFTDFPDIGHSARQATSQ